MLYFKFKIVGPGMLKHGAHMERGVMYDPLPSVIVPSRVNLAVAFPDKFEQCSPSGPPAGTEQPAGVSFPEQPEQPAEGTEGTGVDVTGDFPKVQERGWRVAQRDVDKTFGVVDAEGKVLKTGLRTARAVTLWLERNAT